MERDHQEQVLALAKQAEVAIDAIRDSESFRAYLLAQKRFWRYSPTNTLLILLQDPAATRVAGFDTWKSMGRYVRRGERGIKIIVPAFYRKRMVLENGDEDVREKLFFRLGSVFDVRQTEGKPLPTFDVPILTGDEGSALYAKLAALATREALTIQEGGALFLTNPTMMGYYERTSRLIALRDRLAMLQKVKTLAHEHAHHFGEHTTSNEFSEPEAETAAYIVLGAHGLDSGERSFPYVASWIKDRERFRPSLTNAQKIAKTILVRVDELAADGVTRSESV